VAKKSDLTLDEKLKEALIADWERPYAVPSNWVWTRLGAVCTWGSGGTPSRKIMDYYKGNICWIKTGELNNGYIYDTEEKITEQAIKNSSAKLFPVNTVVIAMYGATIGKIGILAVPATTNQACACAKPTPQIEVIYLFYYALSQKENFIKKAKGGAQPNISQEIIKFHTFPLPPLAEQERIVKRIESLFSKLDQAKELAQSALDSFANRKSAILHQAFTGELTKNWREQNGVNLDSWEKKKIMDTCKVVRGGSPRPAGDEKFYNGNIPFMKVADITRNTNIYIHNAEYSIKGAGLKKTRLVKIGTLLLTNSGATLGVPGITAIDTTFNDGIAAFLDLNENVKFMYYFWTNKTKELRSINKGAAQPNLNTEIIGNININLPSLPEQTEIVRILDSLLEKEDKSKELTNVITQIEHMKKAILARAFRGELDTNDPQEESALELLKEILNKG